MITRLLVAAVCILLLPFWFSASPRGTSQDSPGGSPLAYAGHTLGGNRCECGSSGCTCYPGEAPGEMWIKGTQPESNHSKVVKHGAKGSRGKAESSDLGQLGLLFALALLFWRLRS